MGARRISLATLCLVSLCLLVAGAPRGQETPSKTPAAPSQSPAQTQSQPATQAPFYLHDFHAKQVGLDCDACHVPQKAGSVVYQRPGHDQCTPCHKDDFAKNVKQKICEQCHSVFPPTSSEDLLPYPRYKNERPIVYEFSHAQHADPHARVDGRTGFRADCTFCHHFQADGPYATFGNHVVCASCHSKAGMKPLLSEKSTTADCRGCHRPEEIENPGAATVHRELASYIVSGKYDKIKFSHPEHFKSREEYHLDCTTCHYGVAGSTNLASLTLPKMADCVSCHQVMLPVSHAARWKDDVHGKYAALDRTSCSVCHVSDFCSRCHNELPRSHLPLAQFKAGGHAQLAMINERSCFTCHTFVDTCKECHAKVLK